MIIIPKGMHHEAIMSGSVFKLVRCEVCKTEYIYRMTRTTSGKSDSFLFLDDGDAREKARRQAAQSMNDMFQSDHDVVPCPSCGQIQSQMFEKARQEHTGWFNWVYMGIMLVVAFDGLVLAGMGLSPSPQSSEGALTRTVALVILWTCILSPLLLLPVRAYLRQAFDPNQEDQRARILQGRALAWLREEIEARHPGFASPPAPGIRRLEGKTTEHAGQVRLDDLQKGKAFVTVTFEARNQRATRPGDYCTTLTNVGAEPVRILKFAPCYRTGGMWVFDYCHSDKEFREWYSTGDQLWLAPGASAIDPNNLGEPPILWAYFGETKSGTHFISGAVLSRSI